MNLWSKFFNILLIFLAGTVAGYYYGTSVPAYVPLVEVKLVNASGKDVSSLRLIHSEGTLEINEVEDGQTKTAHFFAPKETTYNLEVGFSDGHRLEAGPRYVEAGIAPMETIKDDEIVPNFTSTLTKKR